MGEIEADEEDEAPPSGPPTLAENLDSLGRNKEAVVEIIETVGDEYARARAAVFGTSLKVAALVFGMMAAIILGVGLLVWYGRVGESILTFVIGIALGYMLKFVEGLRFMGPAE